MKNTTLKNSGFTLIELMVTVAIISILTGIAVNYYDSQSQKNRRSDAVGELSQLQVAIEGCYGDNGGYDCCAAEVTIPAQTPNGHYDITFTVTNTDGTQRVCKQGRGYTLAATPTAGGLQTADVSCQIFQVDNTGLRTATNPQCWGD